jgi:microcystin degradation protein MlrC
VLSNSILLGFPYSDVPEMGSSVVVVTNDQPELAQGLANGLAREIEVNRHDFAGKFLSIDQAIDQALRLEGPVCLLDMGDNVGGGSPGDGTALARAIHDRFQALGNSSTGGQATSGTGMNFTIGARAFVCIDDAQAADLSAASKIGSKLRLEIGGRGDPLQGPPLIADVTVLSLHDGKFTETGTTHGGITQFDQGRTAIVCTGSGLAIMLTSKRTPPFSLRQLTAWGIDPSQFHILVAKGVHAPRAAYAAACKHFLRVDTPGVTRADMTKLAYHHRRRPLFPFEEIEPA